MYFQYQTHREPIYGNVSEAVIENSSFPTVTEATTDAPVTVMVEEIVDYSIVTKYDFLGILKYMLSTFFFIVVHVYIFLGWRVQTWC